MLEKQQIVVSSFCRYMHISYYTYIYIFVSYRILYISLNITKYLLLVHCTKMVFKQGSHGQGAYVGSKEKKEEKKEVRMLQRWGVEQFPPPRVTICAVQCFVTCVWICVCAITVTVLHASQQRRLAPLVWGRVTDGCVPAHARTHTRTHVHAHQKLLHTHTITHASANNSESKKLDWPAEADPQGKQENRKESNIKTSDVSAPASLRFLHWGVKLKSSQGSPEKAKKGKGVVMKKKITLVHKPKVQPGRDDAGEAACGAQSGLPGQLHYRIKALW